MTITDKTRITIGIAAAAVVAAVSLTGWITGAASATTQQMGEVQSRVSAVADHAARNERAIVEARETMRVNGLHTDAKLVRIEDKLDRLIERMIGNPR